MMILVDTNILSTFAKIDRLELLFKVFNQIIKEMEEKDNLKIVSKEEIF